MTKALRALLFLAVTLLGLVTGLISSGLPQCTVPDLRWTVPLAALLVLVVARVWARRSISALPDLVGWSALALVVSWFLAYAVIGPNTLGAIDRGRQKRTMADMRALGGLLEEYRREHGALPQVSTASGLTELLSQSSPDMEIPIRDGWGKAYRLRLGDGRIEIVSAAQCGELEPSPPEGEAMSTQTLEADIVWRDGAFVRYPEGTQP